MRAASFFFISLAVHALALACPLSFPKPKQPEFIPVTVLPAEPQSRADSGQAGGSRSAAPPRSLLSKPSAMPSRLDLSEANDSGPQTEIASAPELFQSPSSPAVLVPTQSTENEGPIQASLSQDGSGSGVGRMGDGSIGGESATPGAGTGSGYGKNGNSAKLTQVGYRETPKPIYPESARQKGRQGTVLLRVLVDDQGRAKTIEINQSSGDDALDRAAGEAIKRWRFSPARYGGKAVESWIRIPIDFHLADTHSR